MRQAQALMQKYGIDHPEILAADVREAFIPTAAGDRPSNYESMLAALVARACGCECIYYRKWSPEKYQLMGNWLYIGCSPGIDVAEYSLDILLRQLRKARKEYIGKHLRRYKKANKTIRADAFCDGWVRTVGAALTRYDPTEEQTVAVQSYIQKSHSNLIDLKPITRSSNKIDTERDLRHGAYAGRTAEVRTGLGTRAVPKLIAG